MERKGCESVEVGPSLWLWTLTSTMVHDLVYLGFSRWKKLYIWNGRVDWHWRKGMGFSRLVDTLCNVDVWRSSWTFKVIFWKSHIPAILWKDAGTSVQSINQSINQSNPVLLKERVHIPRRRRARGAAMLWGRLPIDGVGSCRLFFTDDLHDNLSWVPASDKPHTFKSSFTHSSQVFFGRPGPFLPGTGLDHTLFISPLERMTCPNHLSRRSRTRMARSHIPSLACSSSINGSSDGLTPQIQRIIARSLRHSRWRAAEVMGQVSVPCNIELRTLELNRRPLRSKGTGLDVSKGRFSRNLPQAHLHLAVAAAMLPPPALSMSPR